MRAARGTRDPLPDTNGGYRAGKLTLQTHATSYGDDTDEDKLGLVSLPRP